MAPIGRRQTATLEDELFKEGCSFEFPQAVALLERFEPNGRDLGTGADPSREALRFCVNPRMSFASAAVERIAPRVSAGTRPTITVNFMGLIGVNGALPHPFAEIVLARARRGDTAALAFLDIFHHRLLSLVYRSFKRHYTGLGAKSPEQTPAARYLYSLIGLNTEALRGPSSSGNPAVNTKRTLLHYAGLLAREVRTMSGLAALLTLHFSVPVEGVPLTGAFYAIEPEHQTLLGRRGQNQRLGHTAIVGARYWDQEAAFELKIGPLTEDEYLRFLPEGDALTPLCQLTRFYVGDCLDYRVRLLLDPESARAARPEKRRRVSTQAAKNSGARALLGRTAWVGTAWKTREIVLSGKSLPKDREI